MSFAAAAGMLALTALRVPGPLSDRAASYRIEAALDEQTKTVSGRVHLTWRNGTQSPAHELVFHLYMNAFKNQASTFMRESRGQLRGIRTDGKTWGTIDVSRVLVRGADVTAAWKVDETLARVPAEVAPGETVEVDLEFTTRLPFAFARAGTYGDFCAVTQWFPKIGVFSDERGWRAHQYHGNSEFFADFGVYDVRFTVPARHVVGATGVLVGSETKGDRRTDIFHAEDVHDFALITDPRFRVVETDAEGVHIRLLTLPGHEAHVPLHLRATAEGLRELGRRLGPYPYSQVTVVDVPRGAEGAGGMEYPTLFVTEDVPVPPSLHLNEHVTAHELAHHYFQGIVASDEVEEAFLDEGFTDAMTDFILSRMFGADRAVYDGPLGRLSHADAARLLYRVFAGLDAPATRSFEFLDGATYAMMSYRKTHLTLRSVEALVGPARFEAGLRRYYEDWKFHHPRLADFRRSFDVGAGEDLGWVWEHTLSSPESADYAVRGVAVERRGPPGGLFERDGKRESVPPAPRNSGPWHSEVVVERRGELEWPMDIEVRFADGSVRRERWDARDGKRWHRFTYEDARVHSAAIDPERKLALDATRWNDARSAEPDGRTRRRLLARLWTLLSHLLSLVGP